MPDTDPGCPSIPDCGNATCAGESFVSGRVGERFLAFLRREYAYYTPRRQVQTNCTYDTFIDSAPEAVKHTFVCVDCGGTFRMTQFNGRQKRCKACGDEHKRQHLRELYQKRKAAEAT
jgi:hypothetical protein